MKEIALNRSDETKAKLREAALGKTYSHTEETKIKLRDAALGKKHSEETKTKLRAIQSNRVKNPVDGFKIEVKDMQTGKILYYDSIRAAGKELNSNYVSLSYNLDNGNLFRGRYIFKKLD